MAENVHTISDLYQMQAMPLNLKISMTKRRIRDYVKHFGLDGVYVSFSGGKDSTVLLHIAREMYGDAMKAVFVDTGLEYPEIRSFVKTFDNVDWLRPKMGFKKVCEKYGFPLISKEVSERVYYAKRYLTWYMENRNAVTDRQTDRPSEYGLADLMGLRDYRAHKGNAKPRKLVENIPDDIIMEFIQTGGKGTYKLKELYGMIDHDGKPSQFNYSRYKWMATAPFYISNRCCDVMKKAPVESYTKRTGRVAITAQMASESRLRTLQWLHHGCNAFDAKKQVSNPMSFWTEQDVLLYIKENNIPIASVYGDIVIDYEGMGQCDGQMSLADFMDEEEFDLDRPLLKTTECNRTGCILCGFGCHLEKGEGRFERLHRTHPKAYKVLDHVTNSGVTYREAIEWINENNGKGEIIKL